MKILERILNILAVISLFWVFFVFYMGAISVGYWGVNIAAMFIVLLAMKFLYDSKNNSAKESKS